MFENFKILLVMVVALLIGLSPVSANAKTDTFSAVENIAVEMGSEIDLFELEDMEAIKVAPRDPLYQCKLRPHHPDCKPAKKKKKSGSGEIYDYAKLKCKKAKTCIIEIWNKIVT